MISVDYRQPGATTAGGLLRLGKVVRPDTAELMSIEEVSNFAVFTVEVGQSWVGKLQTI